MIRIDLLKPEKKELREIAVLPVEEIKKEKKFPASSLIIILSIITIVVLFVNQRNAINTENELLEKAKKDKKKLQDVISKLDELESQKALYERKINLITQSKAHQEVAIRIMDELSRNIPDWVWLTEISFSEQELEIKGKALSNNLIADYISNLEKSPHLNNVNLISSAQKTTRDNQYQEFSLTAEYVLPQVFKPFPQENTKKEKK